MKNTTGKTGDGVIDHPPHYNGHASGIEPIEVMRALTSNRAMVFKYITRRYGKGSYAQDVQKALWYAKDERKHAIKQPPLSVAARGALMAYANAEPSIWVTEIYLNICNDGALLYLTVENLILNEKEDENGN